ncbi:MAG: hypothetical protein M5R36_29645 [Deltaproteobacteria bacterium]|nr:hypothetical protein [Deltaproteobacteria bacterium]
MRRRAAIVIILTALAAAVPAAADPLSEGIEAYRASHYDVALKTLNEALLQEGYSTAQIVECRRYLGMTHIAFGDTTRAKGQFVEALKLDPAMSFDPITTSPKVLAVFEEAKAEFEAQRPLEPIPVAEPEAAPEPEPEPEPEAVAEEPVRQERDHTKRTVGWSLVGVGGASLIVSGVTYAMLWGHRGQV